jgi:hypothetical protein
MIGADKVPVMPLRFEPPPQCRAIAWRRPPNTAAFSAGPHFWRRVMISDADTHLLLEPSRRTPIRSQLFKIARRATTRPNLAVHNKGPCTAKQTLGANDTITRSALSSSTVDAAGNASSRSDHFFIGGVRRGW